MKELSLPQALAEAIDEEMERDPKVFVMGENVGPMGGIFRQTQGLYKKWGSDRVKDTPISEDGIIGFSTGAAMGGMRPIAEIMCPPFVGMAMDQIWSHAAVYRYLSGGQVKIPLTIMTTGGCGNQPDLRHGPTHEGTFMGIPGLKFVIPSTPYEIKGLMKTAIRDDSPVLFLSHRMLIFMNIKSKVPDEEYTIPLGKADIKREGSDVTVLAIGYMVHKALAAADKLQEKGISIEVVDLRTLVPLDMEAILNSVKKTGRLVIMSEDINTGGSASIIAGLVAEEGFDLLDAPIKRVTAKDTPLPYIADLENFYLPQEEDLTKAVMDIT